MGLFRKYPTVAVRPPSHNELARDAINRMFAADERGDTATSEREKRIAQQHIDAAKRS